MKPEDANLTLTLSGFKILNKASLKIENFRNFSRKNVVTIFVQSFFDYELNCHMKSKSSNNKDRFR